MSYSPENFLLVGSALLLICIVASKASFKVGIPTVLIFISIGMLAGSDGIGGIYFDNMNVANFLGIVSLSIIIFSGGLETDYENIKPVLGKGIILSTLGVLITAIVIGVFVHLVDSRFTLLEGMLLGSIISSTDAASVFSIFRTKKLGLKHNLRPLLEFESGSNDPMAFFLTVSMIQLLQMPEASVWTLIPMFFKGMVIGGISGFLMGKAAAFILNRLNLDTDSLYPLFAMGFVFFVYTLTDLVGGNGYLAVYITGLMLANHYVVHKRSLIRFFDGISYLMQIVMFLTLGLLVFPSQFPSVFWIGLSVSLFLMLVARPIAVYLCLMFFKMSNRDKLFVSWVGLRGAVPIIFAIMPIAAGLPNANMIFNIVFFISLTSVLFQGSSIAWVARRLRLIVPEHLRKRYFLEFPESENSMMEVIEVRESGWADSHKIMELKLPESVIIVTINRNGKYFIPNGSTVIKSGDQLYVISDHSDKIETAAQTINKKVLI